MHIFFILFFYAFSCSTVLLYGIGLERTLLDSGSDILFFKRLSFFFIASILAVLILWFPVTYIVIPNGFFILVPVFVIMVCEILYELTSQFFFSSKKQFTGEQLFFLGVVFLSIAEAASFTESLLICVAAFLCFFVTTIILFSIRRRLSASFTYSEEKRIPSLILVSMGLLSIVLFSADISWWFSEVFH
ncbi:hypothetical protein K7I13_01415 [Brucepastera parasyntrophica]|uniref:hypothetical protein n=1 Tax=Brucepastera parasyntrophica TaxID=2880008 RepID=UPI002108B3A1|nr:hypothetical protein [Brucepastera parasyntrophica]ULQ60022.1 hypothetical protein K7I13_01415 [Brucepastera parasyntrophica]